MKRRSLGDPPLSLLRTLTRSWLCSSFGSPADMGDGVINPKSRGFASRTFVRFALSQRGLECNHLFKQPDPWAKSLNRLGFTFFLSRCELC